MKIAFHQINPRVGDFSHNLSLIEEAMRNSTADLLMFAECVITGYPVEDLILRDSFITSCHDAIHFLTDLVKEPDMPDILFGSPLGTKEGVMNAAILITKDGIQIRYKERLPNYGVFDEIRTFKAGVGNTPMSYRGYQLGVLICEDMWHHGVAESLREQGADILLVLNGSPYEIGKQYIRIDLAKERAGDIPLLYGNLIGGQDTLVFDGHSFFLNDGTVTSCRPYLDDVLTVDLSTMTASVLYGEGDVSIQASTYGALILGLRDYVRKSGFEKIVLGVSGGMDSAMVAAIAADALGGENVIGVRLPGPYSSQGSLDDARDLMSRIGGDLHTIPINSAYQSMMGELAGVFAHYGKEKPDVTEENLQARTRINYLLSLSNKLGALLMSTGNKSEGAVGYCSFSDGIGFNPLNDLYKTQVGELAKWRNIHIPEGSLCPKLNIIPGNSITKPPSAELGEGQTDESSLLPYGRLDAILHCLIDDNLSIEETMERTGEDRETVVRFSTLLARSEYKRRVNGPGIHLSPVAFDRSRRYPIVNRFFG